MTTALRLGTRGSDLALWQARFVASALSAHVGVEPELVIIQTPGDRQADVEMRPGVWPTGAFVSEIERALAAGEIDLAVHSHKDLATTSLPGLVVVATPKRAPAHDVLVVRDSELADRVRRALAGDTAPRVSIGTSSPRRAAQLQRALQCDIRPIRGNVPTRLGQVGPGKLDAICLAAAGIERLGLVPENTVALRLDRFPTAPAQGAIAVQARADTAGARAAEVLDDEDTHRCIRAERAFLKGISAGCHTPVAAHAAVGTAGFVRLHVQLFKDDRSCFEEHAAGPDPDVLGADVASRAVDWLRT